MTREQVPLNALHPSWLSPPHPTVSLMAQLLSSKEAEDIAFNMLDVFAQLTETKLHTHPPPPTVHKWGSAVRDDCMTVSDLYVFSPLEFSFDLLTPSRYPLTPCQPVGKGIACVLQIDTNTVGANPYSHLTDLSSILPDTATAPQPQRPTISNRAAKKLARESKHEQARLNRLQKTDDIIQSSSHLDTQRSHSGVAPSATSDDLISPDLTLHPPNPPATLTQLATNTNIAAASNSKAATGAQETADGRCVSFLGETKKMGKKIIKDGAPGNNMGSSEVPNGDENHHIQAETDGEQTAAEQSTCDLSVPSDPSDFPSDYSPNLMSDTFEIRPGSGSIDSTLWEKTGMEDDPFDPPTPSDPSVPATDPDLPAATETPTGAPHTPSSHHDCMDEDDPSDYDKIEATIPRLTKPLLDCTGHHFNDFIDDTSADLSLNAIAAQLLLIMEDAEAAGDPDPLSFATKHLDARLHRQCAVRKSMPPNAAVRYRDGWPGLSHATDDPSCAGSAALVRKRAHTPNSKLSSPSSAAPRCKLRTRKIGLTYNELSSEELQSDPIEELTQSQPLARLRRSSGSD